MSHEKSVAVRKHKSEALCSSQLTCIVHYQSHTAEEVRPLSDAQYQTVCDARDIR